ncbi:HEPN domain-containing protein [Stygiolobus caldivivus]|uniref:HEPN domain-containing protein n=1 Tax=Stygiolobus caldivivus TaxID=2824673 RepID=A0A8D5ZJ14_9CREN|nr:HEPN domain-containing protein [Stygiolobus caldivivus]BCU69752.1 hypothetical protein KN1_10490 [Stygiolobus caldivivus]
MSVGECNSPRRYSSAYRNGPYSVDFNKGGRKKVVMVDFLRTNAKQFLEQAKFSMQRGFYNLVLFNVEQSVQLNLKYLLYLSSGDFPKTHRLSDLFRLIKAVDDPCGVYTFYEGNKDFLTVIELSYISSRYLPQSFSEEDAEKALKLGEEFDKLVEGCVKSTKRY